jgi:hypothetical protein
VPPDWSTYWRSADEPLEAMHAHFERHVYHRHSHESYSFGVTDDGAQAFTCRGSAHTSAAGMVMAFNPDDPHDGRPSGEMGFTYRMVHVGPGLVSDVLAGLAGRPAGLPLFAASAARLRCGATSCSPPRFSRSCGGPPCGQGRWPDMPGQLAQQPSPGAPAR